MKKYGYNWVLSTSGVLLTLGVLSGSRSYIVAHLFPSKYPRTADRYVFSIVMDTLMWTLLWFWLERATHKRQQKAARATETTPLKVEDTTPPRTATKITIKELLLGTFGLSACIVGPPSLIAHVWRGNLSATQVVVYTFAVPSLMTIGAWFICKAKLPGPATTAPRSAQTQTTTPDVLPRAVVCRIEDAEV